MGLFTNPCINPECGQRVRKGAKFCPKCGSPAPKGLGSCGQCGAEVRTASKFCWKCGADLAKVAKPVLLDQKWVRQSEAFAVRVEVQDVKGWLTKPITIEHGTKALLFQKGKFKGDVGEGRHEMGGFLNRLNHFMIDQATTLVLLDAGDVTIDLENGGLWTTDNFEVGCIERIVLRLVQPEAMFVNLLKSGNSITRDDLETQLAGEVQMLLSGIVSRHTAKDVFSNPAIRTEIETALRESIAATFGRLGLELVQLRFISFAGEAYEKLRQARGEVAAEAGEAEIAEDRAKVARRLRETLSAERMDSFKSEKDVADFIRQTEHELGLKEIVRDDEIAHMAERLQHDRDRDAVVRRVEIEGIADDGRRKKAWQDLMAEEEQRDERHQRERERGLEQAKTDVEKSRLEHEQDMAEARDGVALLKEVQASEQEVQDREQQREAATLEARSKATAQALLSIVDGPAGEQIVAMEKLRAQQHMTPEQILALAAAASPDAARALAQKYESDGKLSAERAGMLEKQLADQRQMAEGHADRMERVLQTSLAQMGAVAGAAAQPAVPRQTIVTGAGRAMVIGAAGTAGACKHCGAALEADGLFCPQCGKKQ